MTKNSPIAELPRAIDAEESVIGCILLHGVDVYEDVQPWIKNAEVFYKEIHQELWKACTSLYKENQTIDIITVKEKLNEMKLNLINKDDYGAYYLTGLTQGIIGKANIKHHAKIVYEKYEQRKTAVSSY